jgi:hypothetical protein
MRRIKLNSVSISRDPFNPTNTSPAPSPPISDVYTSVENGQPHTP